MIVVSTAVGVAVGKVRLQGAGHSGSGTAKERCRWIKPGTTFG
jgi:hypothetical protein